MKPFNRATTFYFRNKQITLCVRSQYESIGFGMFHMVLGGDRMLVARVAVVTFYFVVSDRVRSL